MERHEALVFVSQLYDHRQSWTQRLGRQVERMFLAMCSRTNSAKGNAALGLNMRNELRHFSRLA